MNQHILTFTKIFFLTLGILALTAAMSFISSQKASADDGAIPNAANTTELSDSVISDSFASKVNIDSEKDTQLATWEANPEEVKELALGVWSQSMLSGGISFDYEKGQFLAITTSAGLEALKSVFSPSQVTALNVTVADDLSMALEASIVGGKALGNYCTGGFPAVRNGVYGIVTAAHCLNTVGSGASSYDGSTITSVFYAPSQYYADLAFVGLQGNTTMGLVQTAPSTFEQMVGIAATNTSGSSYCHFGVVTGKHCSTIVLSGWNFIDPILGVRVDNLTVSASQISEPGDSGGPWYTNSAYGSKKAVGIHIGKLFYSGISLDMFAPISEVNSLLGADLYITSIQ